MNNIIKWILRSSAYLYITLYVSIILFCFCTELCGLTKYVVTSGSMMPQLLVGSCIWVRELPPEILKKGDIITFLLTDSDTIVTHRILSVNTETKTVQTKGDANNLPDAADIPYDHILGKVVLHFPWFGHLLLFLSDPLGQTASFCFLFLCCVLLWMTTADTT